MYKTYVVKETLRHHEAPENAKVIAYPLATLQEAYDKLYDLYRVNFQFENLDFEYELLEKVWNSNTDELEDINLLERKTVIS